MERNLSHFSALLALTDLKGSVDHIITLAKNMSKSRKMSYNTIHCHLVGIVLLTKRKSDMYLLIILYEFKYSTVG